MGFPVSTPIELQLFQKLAVAGRYLWAGIFSQASYGVLRAVVGCRLSGSGISEDSGRAGPFM